MDKSIETIERELLSILFYEMKKGIKYLQIKPWYLKNEKHQKILEAMISANEKNGFVSLEGIASVDLKIIDYIAEVICEDWTPIINIEKQFMNCQKIILDYYKKKVLNDLNKKLDSGELSFEEYSMKVSKANMVNINDDVEYLTKKEINENISTDDIGIRLKNYKNLSDTLKLVQGDFLIIGATTGTGKSGLMLNLMNDLMENYQCIYFNMEMSKSTIYKRMIAINSNVPVYDIDKPKTDYQKSLVEKAIDEITKNKVIVEHKAGYLHEIKALLSKRKDNTRHTIIFLDHIGLVKNADRKSIYEQMTDVAKQLRQYCLDYDCTIISACQLNRSSYSSDKLNLSMLKDSGELENSASKVILLYKDDKNISKEQFKENMVLDIVKNRDGQLGKVGCIYDKTKQIFKEDISYVG